MIARLGEEGIELPGLATAHSHAFQRGLRGRTQRRTEGPGSFWSWRGLMYRFAEQLDPESIYAISRFAFVELALAGVTAVGEFHYVHHDRDGRPYADRTILADAVIRAARDAGIRITLLRVLYNRAGADATAEGAQRRFCDDIVDDALADIETLAKRYADDDAVTVGVAPHSVRAVPRQWIGAAAEFARERELPLHMHVCEQRRELDECRAEHGVTPVQLLADDGVLNERFVAVHATHLDDAEAGALGRARAFACLCRTTERDLGDGSPNVQRLVAAGVRLCTGVDSHAVSDPWEEARAIELDERTRTQARVVAAEAADLLRAATSAGYAAIGIPGREAEDTVVLDGRDPGLVGASDELDDLVLWGASPRAVRTVEVAGHRIVDEGRHFDYEPSRSAYESALRRVLE